ncbi:MAG TPA: DNA polymerase I [Patescibacteria group bacterium]|nr:DNA polymerase I [Patescibacteria group bacterium]
MAEKFKKIMLIDGNALVHRGFHALPELSGPSGEPTGAIYGFTMILLRAIKDLKPTHIACCFDLAGPTFRHEKYKDYKATRTKAPQELYDQIPACKELVRAMGIPVFEKKGFEADDLLGTLSRTCCEQYNNKCKVMIVTGDMDTLQLVNECVSVHTLRKGISDVISYGPRQVFERYGLHPGQMVDFRALRGDSSDNIKGVKGIGEKGATELIREFGSLKGIYEAIEDGSSDGKIKERIRNLLLEQKESAELSYELSKIDTLVELKTEVPEFVFSPANLRAVLEQFGKLGFKSLVAQLPNVGEAETGEEVQEEVETKQHKDIKSHYYFLDTESKVEKAVEKIGKATEIAFDTETTNIDPLRSNLVGVSISPAGGTAYYVESKLVSKNLIKLLEKRSLKKVGHNAKYDILALRQSGIEVSGVVFDTMIASYLLDAGTRRHSLDDLSLIEFGHKKISTESLIGKGAKQITMDQVPAEKVANYACEDADFTMRLREIFEDRLKEEGLWEVFRDIEMPLIPVLADMEARGIQLDTKHLKKLSAEAEISLKDVEQEIYKLAGSEFNIASPKQLKEILFEKMGLEPVDNKKVKTGLSTAASELEKMRGQHKIIECILEYRELAKLQNTYLTVLPDLVNPKTNRLHTSYNQTIAATGRLSSVDPNLQNIPVRGDGIGGRIREAFVAKDGYELLSLDYSQIELRVVAHLAQDENMMRVFNQGEDIHTNTARAIFGLPASKITEEHRRYAKTVNFGILYGLQAFGLASRVTNLDFDSAKDFISNYFLAYPGVKEYMEKIKLEARTGRVRSQTGRVRKFPDIKSRIFALRAAAERAAMNFPIQSLAADVIKVAMINIHPELKDKKDEIQMLLQVHDELVFEVREDKVEHYTKLIKPIMEEAIQLSVPIVVEAKVGKNWGKMKKI